MIEKVNPMHPDKVADRIAGAIVDLAYTKSERPKIAVEVLIGHSKCHIIAETSVHFTIDELQVIVDRISKERNVYVDYVEVPQDAHLAANQEAKARCGDNGIFKGVPTSPEEERLSGIVRALYSKNPTDGKYVYDDDFLFIACQSNCNSDELKAEINGLLSDTSTIYVNPLGEWTGGINVDTGATNRKLGSDMGRAVTGGGLHGKDLSKADVSVNIYCHLLAQRYGTKVEALCAIGDEEIEFRIFHDDDNFEAYYSDYADVVYEADKFIRNLGGFEKLAEWGLF